MTKIDFYILGSDDPAERLHLVCKLINKAANRGQRVFVHSDDLSLLEQLDECLLHFQPDRFIAHRLLNAQDAPAAVAESRAEPTSDDIESVLLSTSTPTRTDAVFLNLAKTVPVFFSRFERTLEVVDRQESIRLDGRERYRFYKERGYPLQHHNL